MIKHAHKLKRHTYKTGTKVYFCTLPDCTYRIQPEFTLGKITVCWRCGEEFTQNESSARLAKPHCLKCHKTKNEIEIKIPILDEMIDETFTNKKIAIPTENPVLSLKERLLSAIGKADIDEGDDDIL